MFFFLFFVFAFIVFSRTFKVPSVAEVEVAIKSRSVVTPLKMEVISLKCSGFKVISEFLQYYIYDIYINRFETNENWKNNEYDITRKFYTNITFVSPSLAYFHSVEICVGIFSHVRYEIDTRSFLLLLRI